MSIKPVDMQVIVVKTQQASKIQHNTTEKHNNLLYGNILDQNKRVEKEIKQVNKTSESYKSKINQHKERKNNKKNKRQFSKKRDENNNEKSKTANNNKTVGRNIDIKI